MTRMINAVVCPDGEFWLVYVPEVDRHTQARTLAEVPAMARGLASLVLDVPVSDVELDQVDIVEPPTEPVD